MKSECLRRRQRSRSGFVKTIHSISFWPEVRWVFITIFEPLRREITPRSHGFLVSIETRFICGWSGRDGYYDPVNVVGRCRFREGSVSPDHRDCSVSEATKEAANDVVSMPGNLKSCEIVVCVIGTVSKEPGLVPAAHNRPHPNLLDRCGRDKS